MKLKLVHAAHFAFLALVCTTLASAAPIIVGSELQITGTLRIGADFADFIPLGGPSGNFNVEPTSTGSFASLVDPGPSDDGDALDLDSTNAPVGVQFSLPNFLTFDLDPTMSFELTFVEPGAFAPCPAGLPAACSVNAFNLVRTGTSVVANFNVRGTIQSGSDLATFQGSFSHVFTNRSISSLLNQIGAAGFINTPFGGDFVVTGIIPEPGTIVLLFSGLGVLGLAGLLKRSQLH
jgi:hypothetical protein